MAKRLKLQPISEELVLSRLRFENPWWVSGKIDPEYHGMQPRLYFGMLHQLVSEANVRRAVVLMGPRRVGKTVMMHHSVQKLLDDGVNPKKIAFISIDNPIYLYMGLEQLFSLVRKAVADESLDQWYLFFDEIQYLKDWEIHLKVMVDSYPHTKIIVSGSAAAALRLKSNESGAGRFTEFMLPPLTFHEYIQLKKFDHLIRPSSIAWNGNINKFFTSSHLTEVNKHFIDYINFGGYPEVIFSEAIQANPGRYIKSDIVDKVLLRDLPSLYGIQDVQELNAFFTTLAYYSGNEVSLDVLSKSSGIDKNLLKKYLEYLEAAFLVRVIHRVDDTAKKFQRANFYKVFLTNPSLRSALFAPLEATDDLFGSMVETAIFSQWIHRYWFTPWYARWISGRTQGEVDMIGLDNKSLKPAWAVEVKWSNRYYERPEELKSLLHFCEKNNLKSALVTTIDKEGSIEKNGITLNFVPSSIYAYVVGVNTLEIRGKL
ncbi:ATP-binding protein [Dyadobacter sp. OTU695]|uniref:ATP-binding protein n=1 Tax=Dyadobacter sp. OTU695 TaxID=3043860 RepID=UPI00313DAF2B